MKSFIILCTIIINAIDGEETLLGDIANNVLMGIVGGAAMKGALGIITIGLKKAGLGKVLSKVGKVFKKKVNNSKIFKHGELFESSITTKKGVKIESIYDININGKILTLEWEGRQLVKYIDSQQGKTITYKYNDTGYRIYKKVEYSSTKYDEYKYTLDGDKVLYEEIKHLNNSVESTDKIYYTYDLDGKLISMNLNGTEYFYIRNLQNDIVKIVDENKNIMVEYYYDAWGKILYTKDNSTNNLAKINSYRYCGYRYDDETNYYYLNSRYYNPEIGRFISADGQVGETGDLLGHNLCAPR